MSIRSVASLLLLAFVSGAPAVGTAAELQQPEPKKTKVNSARVTGMKAAIADIEAGKLKQKSSPLPDPLWHGRYVELLKKECGVEWEMVTEKATDELIAGMGGYNDVMRVEIEHRFGQGILNKLSEKAKSKEKK